MSAAFLATSSPMRRSAAALRRCSSRRRDAGTMASPPPAAADVVCGPWPEGGEPLAEKATPFSVRIFLEHGAECRVLGDRRAPDPDELADLCKMERGAVHGQGLAGGFAGGNGLAQTPHRLPAAFRAAAPGHASPSL